MSITSDPACGSGLCGISSLQRSLRCKRQFSDVGLHILDCTSPALPCNPFINTTLGASATPPVNTAPRSLAPSVKQFGVAALVQVGQCWLYLRHRGSSRPAFSRHQTSPRRPTSARARHRLGCSSLRTCVKRLDRSGVLPSISTLPPPPSHVGCHQSQSKRHSPFV